MGTMRTPIGYIFHPTRAHTRVYNSKTTIKMRHVYNYCFIISTMLKSNLQVIVRFDSHCVRTRSYIYIYIYLTLF